MRLPSLKQLGGMALAIAVTATGAINYTDYVYQKRFRNEDYYKRSLEILKKYTPVVDHLGPPIKLNNINLYDNFSSSDGYKAQLKIPLQGKKSRGTLFVRASRSHLNHNWKIDMLDIQVNNGEPWTFYRE